MILESLFTSILFEPGGDSYIFGNRELLEKTRLQEKVNDVGTSNYSIYPIYPQPKPVLRADGFATFEDIFNAQVKIKRRKKY